MHSVSPVSTIVRPNANVNLPVGMKLCKFIGQNNLGSEHASFRGSAREAKVGRAPVELATDTIISHIRHQASERLQPIQKEARARLRVG